MLSPPSRRPVYLLLVAALVFLPHNVAGNKGRISLELMIGGDLSCALRVASTLIMCLLIDAFKLGS